MTQPQLLLDQALHVLDRVGPLTTGALARQLSLSDHASYIMMLSAEANRLIYANTAGQWAITERGRQTLEASRRRASGHPPA